MVTGEREMDGGSLHLPTLTRMWGGIYLTPSILHIAAACHQHHKSIFGVWSWAHSLR